MNAPALSVVQPVNTNRPRIERVHAKLRRAELALAAATAAYTDLMSTAAEEASAMSVFHGQGALEALVTGMGGLSTTRREIGKAHLCFAEVRADYDGEGGDGDEFGGSGGKPKNRLHVG